jgi:hypothetical protein
LKFTVVDLKDIKTVQERRQFLDKCLLQCEPSDIEYLTTKLNEYKRDFILSLPLEIVEVILAKLDWKSLLNCCLVILCSTIDC